VSATFGCKHQLLVDQYKSAGWSNQVIIGQRSNAIGVGTALFFEPLVCNKINCFLSGAAISFFSELKRRRVFKVAIVYLAAAWLLLQVAATVAPILELPAWFEKAVLLLLAVSFPVAVILAWAFQLTPAGVQRDTGSKSLPSEDRRAADRIVVLVLGLALAYFVADKFFLIERDMHSPLEASVAVLPFTNMTQDDSNDPFAAGIHDDLLTHLSRIASLKTTSRTSVLQYRGTTKTIPQIGAELGVATIVEAGVQRSGNRVRINVQLIDAAADEHLWAETYDRELTAANVFEIQSEIARAIAEQLQAVLTSISKKSSNWIRILPWAGPGLPMPTCFCPSILRLLIEMRLESDQTLPSHARWSCSRIFPM